MESESDVVMFRSPLYNDRNNVVFMFQYVAFNNLPDYRSRHKRRFLNKCIRQIYLMHGLEHKLHFDNDATVACSPDVLQQQLDYYMQPEPTSPWKNKRNQCKRRLFLQEQQPRKQINARRNPRFGATKAMYMKPVRHLIPREEMQRGFLNPVRRTTMLQMLRESLDENNITVPEIRDRVEGEAKYIADINADTIISLTESAKRMDVAYTRQKLRIAVERNRMMMEESVRSIMYAQQLYNLMIRNNEGQVSSSSSC